jgi:hypothetical protein
LHGDYYSTDLKMIGDLFRKYIDDTDFLPCLILFSIHITLSIPDFLIKTFSIITSLRTSSFQPSFTSSIKILNFSHLKPIYNMVKYPETAYIAPWFIGGNGGGDFECYANTGGIIKSIGVWSDIRDVTAVQIKFTDGEDKYKFGSGAWGDYKEYVFDVGETVKSMSLWGNGSGTNCGRIRFTTSKGTEFDSGGKRGKKEFPMDVGSGIWVGVAGRCGGSIDRLGVSFLKEVDSMSMSDVKFKNDPTGKFGNKYFHMIKRSEN